MDPPRALATALGHTSPIVIGRDNALAGRFHVRELPMGFGADASDQIPWVGSADQSVDEVEAAVRAAR